MNARAHWFYRVWSGLLLGLMAFFIVNIALMEPMLARVHPFPPDTGPR